MWWKIHVIDRNSEESMIKKKGLGTNVSYQRN